MSEAIRATNSLFTYLLKTWPLKVVNLLCTSVCSQVEGCERLLRDEKPYYQRFLVCEEHMRCLSLDINGQLSRFCQQCGKFEPLEAFDNNKRCGHVSRPSQH